MDADYKFNGSNFYDLGFGDIVGLYDWLRTEQGEIIGFRYWISPELLPAINAISRRGDSFVTGTISLEIFFSHKREFSEAQSNNLDFEYCVFWSNTDQIEFAIEIGATGLTDDEINRLQEYIDA